MSDDPTTLIRDVRGLSWEGYGVVRGEAGARIHVPGLLPGERARVAHTGGQGERDHGVATDVVRGHPARETPFCGEFDGCQRCPLMPYPAVLQRQVRAKLFARLRDKVARETGVVLPDPEWTLFEWPRRWQRRVRFRYRARAGEAPDVGFMRADRTRIERLDDCPVAAEPLGSLLPHLREAFADFPLDGTGQVVAALDDRVESGLAVVCVRAEDGHFPDPDWCEELAARSWPVRGVRLVDREGRERFRAGDARYRLLDGDGTPGAIPATVGLPIEDEADVIRAVRDVARPWIDGLERPRGILECFAGVGAHTAWLWERTDQLAAVTTPAEAIDDLHRNLGPVAGERVQRAYGSLRRGLATAFRKPERYDLVVAWVPARGAVGLWRTLADVGARDLLTSHGSLESALPDMKRIVGLGYRPSIVHAIEAEPHRGRVVLVVGWRME